MVKKKITKILSTLCLISIFSLALVKPVQAADRDFYDIKNQEMYSAEEYRNNDDKFDQLLDVLIDRPEDFIFELRGKEYNYKKFLDFIIEEHTKHNKSYKQAMLDGLNNEDLQQDIFKDAINLNIKTPICREEYGLPQAINQFFIIKPGEIFTVNLKEDLTDEYKWKYVDISKNDVIQEVWNNTSKYNLDGNDDGYQHHIWRFKTLKNGEAKIGFGYNKEHSGKAGVLCTVKVEEDSKLDTDFNSEYEKDIPIFKSWKVVFNQSLDFSTINDNNIYVIDSDGNKLPLIFSFSCYYDYGGDDWRGRGNYINIYPKDSYETSTDYTLHITKGLKDVKGESLEDEITKQFSTRPESQILNNDVVNEIEVGKIGHIKAYKVLPYSYSYEISDEEILKLDAKENDNSDTILPIYEDEELRDAFGCGSDVIMDIEGEDVFYFKASKKGECTIKIIQHAGYNDKEGKVCGEYKVKVVDNN